jgi:malate dehydrogenase (oxaloacetate-decarboxylating)
VFRGALDANATRITTKMKLAAAEALAALVVEPTMERVIPWSLDRAVPQAVAKATAESWE